ncbi:MAG: hypothetical protein WC587_02820 [Candidatus Paceibacterota bacterium]
MRRTGFELGDLYSFPDGRYLGNSRTDWDRFVNDYFLPWDEVAVSDRFFMAFLMIVFQILVLFFGWCAEGFLLVNLMKSDNPILPLNLFLLAASIIFCISYFIFRITKGLVGFTRYKATQKKHKKVA